jgi:phenylacetate-CoA ligase
MKILLPEVVPMNPLLNPFIALPLLKSYLLDHGRIQRSTPRQLKRYIDKEFRTIVKYAYTVPLYNEKYKKAGIHPNNIRGIQDIVKLPFITKNDVRENFPDRIIPVNYKKEDGHVISTGGTTGKPVSIYTDFYTMGKALAPLVREMEFFHFHWRKSKFAHIGNFTPDRTDLVIKEHFVAHLAPFFSIQNQLNIDVNEPIIEIMNKLEAFQPELILSYPSTYQHLAYMKRKGYGKNVQPKLLWTAGSILDGYTKSYVENAFNCRLLNMYPSVEANSDMAFECLEGTWHIHSDFFCLEAIDEEGNVVAPGERGHVVMTRLYGKGTPMVRYVGMDDWVRISPDEKCACGLRTPVILGGVEGRSKANIVFPNGKVFPPGAFCYIENILNKYHTFKIRQYQIIQRKIDELEILLIIDEDLRNVGVSVDEIFTEIKKIYQEKAGPDVEITVREVNEIKGEPGSRKPPPIVISYVTVEDGYKVLNKKNKGTLVG